jgi:hypothetical protein
MEVHFCNPNPQKVEIRRIMVRDQPRQKVSEITISTNKPGMVYT